MDPLAQASIGDTAVEVTRLGLGSAPLGGWPQALPKEEGLATVQRAWDLGLRYFDTAPHYGYSQAERWMGEVLRQFSRDDFVLSSKVGRMLVPTDEEPVFFAGDHKLTSYGDYSYGAVHRSLAESLERLGLERVDVALVHDPDDTLHEAIAGCFRALKELREEGVVRAIGAGMNWSEPLAYLAERVDLDCVLLAGRYTLLEQDALDQILPLARDKGMSVVAGGVFNSGLLADPRPGAPYNYAPAEPHLVERATRLQEACARFGVPLRAAAIQFPLANPAIVSVVVGARTPREIEENFENFRLPIPGELWAHLKEIGLMREDAPVPT